MARSGKHPEDCVIASRSSQDTGQQIWRRLVHGGQQNDTYSFEIVRGLGAMPGIRSSFYLSAFRTEVID